MHEHEPNEDCMYCAECGECSENLNDDDLCPECDPQYCSNGFCENEACCFDPRPYCAACHAVYEQGQREPGPIVVTLEGGLIQNVSTPPGVTVIVRDYDTDGIDTNQLSTDPAGRQCIESLWGSDV
jgi:hypothetical protein